MTIEEINTYLINERGYREYDSYRISAKLFGADKEFVDKYVNHIQNKQ